MGIQKGIPILVTSFKKTMSPLLRMGPGCRDASRCRRTLWSSRSMQGAAWRKIRKLTMGKPWIFFFREPVHKSEKPRRTIEKPQKNHRIDLKPTGRYDRYEVEGKTWLAWEATVAPSWSEGCHLAMFWQHSICLACSLAKNKPVTWFITPIKIDPSCLFFAYSCFWYSKEVPFVRQVCGCAPVTWLRKFFEKWQALQIEDPNYESTLNYIILYRHVTISQERFILFPWNLKQNGQETSHNSWLPVVAWTFCHWNTSVLFPAPGAESIVRFAKEQHRKAGSTSGARASMGSYPQHTPSNI